MEVLDNSNHIKDNEDQTSASNYACRLSRDLNIGNSSVARSKGETDVRLLVACKTQLSSEVIKWKTESLRLQKERDAARLRMKELDHVVGRYCEKTRELENRLSIAEDENKRLKREGKVPSSPNASALQKLYLSLDKFHSYPWLDTEINLPALNSCLNAVEEQKNSVPQEDWKEVSQQLLEKMKQEMKELQELSCNFSSQEIDNDQLVTSEPEVFDVNGCDDKIEASLSGLISDTISIKKCLLEQRMNLKTLLSNVVQGNLHVRDRAAWKEASKAFKTLQLASDRPTHLVKPKPSMGQSSRHSDDSFREFFTKHLEGCQNIDKMSKTMQLFMQSDSHNIQCSNRSPVKSCCPKSAKPPTERNALEDERVCPICQSSFDYSIPQKKFEEHVLDHLEEESASLLDQYVVL